MGNEFSQIGKNVPRNDAIDKVTGRAKYGTDMKLDGMLYAKMLPQPAPLRQGGQRRYDKGGKPSQGQGRGRNKRRA